MLIILDQVDVESQNPNFHPPFLVGCPEVLDPYTNVMLPSYGITDTAAADYIHGMYILWGKSSGVSGGRGLVEGPRG
jgi:hypothetical protein